MYTLIAAGLPPELEADAQNTTHHHINPTFLASHLQLLVGMALGPPGEEEYTSLERAESVVHRHARLQGSQSVSFRAHGRHSGS
jgi:hypothetical protein